jgi:hypothetical protein
MPTLRLRLRLQAAKLYQAEHRFPNDKTSAAALKRPKPRRRGYKKPLVNHVPGIGAYLASATAPLTHPLVVLPALALGQLLHAPTVTLAALVLAPAPPVLLLQSDK